MDASRLKAATLLLLGFLGACAEALGANGSEGAALTGSRIDVPVDWGVCDPGYIIEGPRRNVLIVPERGWVELPNEVASVVLSSGAANGLGFLTIGTHGAVSVFGGDVPSNLKLDYLVVEDANEAVELGADLLIGYSLENPITATGSVFALLPQNDEAILLSICSKEQTDEIRGVAAAAEAFSVIEFVRRATDPTSPERKLLVTQLTKPRIESVDLPAWYELDPKQRSLDPSDAPPEIVDQLQHTFLVNRLTKHMEPGRWQPLRLDGTGVGQHLCCNLS